VIVKQDTYFVRYHSDSPHKYSEADIKGMLSFLVDNIYVIFEKQVFEQSVGIPMETNCDPLYWQTYHIHMKQNLFKNCYRIEKNSPAIQPHIQI
jgi:hypothetical protein